MIALFGHSPRIALLLVGILGASGFMLVSARPPTAKAHVSSQHGVPFNESVLGIPFGRFQMKFSPRPRPATVITESEAVTTAEIYEPALTWDGLLLPGVTVDAVYGLWSSDVMAAMNASGHEVLTYQDVPVWIVRFTGPGFDVGPPPGTPDGEAVVVNASTGHALISFH